MRLVVTNDDGIDAAGLHALCAHLVAGGNDVTVVAPDEDRSGASASIGRLTPGRGVPVTEEDDFPVAGVRAYRLNGPPGLAAMTACLGAFGPPPEVLVSGINAGPNTGHAILHSGTVGAALTAQTFGTWGLAVSVADTQPWRWDTACHFATDALERLRSEPAGTVLNLNAPGVAPEDALELRWATLDRFGSVRLAVAGHGRGEVQFELRATGAQLDPDSDTALLDRGHATLTRLLGVSIGSPSIERAPVDAQMTLVEQAPPG